MRALTTIVALVLAATIGCKSKAPPAAEGGEKPSAGHEAKGPEHAAAGHVDEPEHEGLPRRVKLTPAVVADAKIVASPVTREVLEATLALPGELVADPDKTARISTPVQGRLIDVRLREGARVRKGDVLAIVRVPELGKVRASFAATSAKATAARANADRTRALADKGLAPTQEAISSAAEASALEAEARAHGEQARVLGVGTGEAAGGSDLTLRSPRDGIVIARNAVVGQPVTADETIATITDLAEVWFLGRVFEKDLAKMRLGARAEVTLNAYPKERFEGAVEYVAQQIDPVARTVTARIRLTNRENVLRVGLFGTARVATGEGAPKPPTLVIPRTALTEIGGKQVVFVRHPDGDFELHDVVLGDAVLGKVEVLSGLREGETVVTEGAFTLKSVVLKSTIAEDE